MFTDSRSQARYDEMIARGESPTLAEMLAARTFPGIRSSARLMRGVAVDDGLRDHPCADMIRAAADRAGISRAGKRWVGGLANRWDDPRAWVSDEHDVRAIAHERGYAVSGAFNVAGPSEVPELPPPQVAQDIVEDEVRRRTEIDPGLNFRNPAELREEVRDDLTLPLASSTPVVPEFARAMMASQERSLVEGS